MDKFNYNETYLIESFFDDIDDDINVDYNNQVSSKLLTKALEPIIKKCIEKLYKCINDDASINISYDLTDHIIIINSKDIILFTDINLLQEVYDDLHYIYDSDFSIKIKNSPKCYINNLNSKLIYSFNGYNSKLIFENIEKNVVISHLILSNVIFYTDNNYNTALYFSQCDFQLMNTTEIYNFNIMILDCKNISDYSFIKKVNIELHIWPGHNGGITNNEFKGIPKGNYKLDYLLTYSNIIVDNNNIIDLTNIPNTLTNILIYIDSAYINNFSLKGLTKSLINKLNIVIVFDNTEKYNNVAVITNDNREIQSTLRLVTFDSIQVTLTRLQLTAALTSKYKKLKLIKR